MQYCIEGFSQAGLIKNGLDAKDAVLLRFMMNFISSGKMNSIIYENKTFFWFFYQNIIDEMPILGIKNRNALAKRLKILVEKGILDMHLERGADGVYTYYRLTEKAYSDLVSNTNHSPQKKIPHSPDKKGTPPPIGRKGPSPKVETKTRIQCYSNTNNSETKSKESLRDSKRSPNEYFLKVIKRAKKLAKFKNKLPESDKTTKTYFKAEDFLAALQDGSLKEKYLFDPTWVEKNGIDFDNLLSRREKTGSFEMIPSDKLEPIIIGAVKNYAAMMKEGFWPFDKRCLTKSVADFCYNYKTKKSWLLYCIFNEPKETQNVITKKIIESLDKDDYEFAESMRDELGWDGNKFWPKLSILKNWYDEVNDILYRYNQMSGVDWNSKVATFTHLLDLIDQFRETWKSSWTVGHFGYGNKTWKLFVEWVKSNHNIELEPDCLLNLVHGYETKFKKTY